LIGHQLCPFGLSPDGYAQTPSTRAGYSNNPTGPEAGNICATNDARGSFLVRKFERTVIRSNGLEELDASKKGRETPQSGPRHGRIQTRYAKKRSRTSWPSQEPQAGGCYCHVRVRAVPNTSPQNQIVSYSSRIRCRIAVTLSLSLDVAAGQGTEEKEDGCKYSRPLLWQTC
jgi:hypothetical protein